MMSHKSINLSAIPILPRYRLLDCGCFGGGQSNKAPHIKPIETTPTRVTTVVEYNSDAYVVQAQPKHDVQLTDSVDLEPLSCFHIPSGLVTKEHIQALYGNYLRSDDVFCHKFLKNILIITDDKSLDNSIIDFLTSWGCTSVFLAPTSEKVAPGPYFFSCRGLFWAWKLFPDHQEAFILSTIRSQHDPNLYENLNASAFGAATLCVAVPSRLYFTKTPELPLAGMRIAIKDLFHLNGVNTGCGNRAYRRLYPPSRITSAVVQAALNQGAIVIGKTKTVEFGGSQEVVGDWSDYSYAFNARGDGYLASTGSSTGSASSMAAYPWIDIALGTDAGGSIRDPAVAQGLYGFRPTHDGTPAQDVVIPCPVFHTPGFLGRSCKTMLQYGQQWLPSAPSEIDGILSVNRVLFPPEYESNRKDVQTLVEKWVTTLSEWLKVEVNRTSIEEKWRATRPPNTRDIFSEFFSRTFIDIISSEYWTYAAPFRKEYQDRFCSAPYVCKVTQWLWNKGKSIPSSRKEEALTEITTHNEWFSKHFFNNNDILIAPRYKLDYRDEYLPAPEHREFYGFDSNLHASFAGLPNLIVPIGQCSYHSNITEREEVFPVSVSIVGPKGKDLELLKLVHAFLSASGMPINVSTGSAAFDG